MKDRELFEEIEKTYSSVQNRILLYAQACLQPEQFQAFRKLVLDEFGMSGAKRKIIEIFGMERE